MGPSAGKVEESYEERWKSNPMLEPRLLAVTLNIAVGRSGEVLERAASVLEELTGQKPVQRRAKRTIKEFGIRKREPIAVSVTVRGKKAYDLLDRVVEAVGRKVKASSFDEFGNFAFGIREHIDIPGMKYKAEVGVFGMDVIVTMGRAGYRVARRRLKRRRIPKRHRLTKEEAIEYVRKRLKIEVVEEE
ncbi:MAG TPA: 50S ribosomal protein L5 [Candidatus Korarchaeota archaeon]|nr:MAG: 50S ribosomal protein L5 [Candidatus Korarchaeota archaeon]HDI86144.1 50S ribosomal protein L5 [Candidatus Korarchaeota archaeon]